jgi:hypothetical protein
VLALVDIYGSQPAAAANGSTSGRNGFAGSSSSHAAAKQRVASLYYVHQGLYSERPSMRILKVNIGRYAPAASCICCCATSVAVMLKGVPAELVSIRMLRHALPFPSPLHKYTSARVLSTIRLCSSADRTMITAVLTVPAPVCGPNLPVCAAYTFHQLLRRS